MKAIKKIRSARRDLAERTEDLREALHEFLGPDQAAITDAVAMPGTGRHGIGHFNMTELAHAADVILDIAGRLEADE